MGVKNCATLGNLFGLFGVYKKRLFGSSLGGRMGAALKYWMGAALKYCSSDKLKKQDYDSF